MSPQRSLSSPNTHLLRLHHQRTELERAIRLLEAIKLIRQKRPADVVAIIAKARRLT
jgi:hypothetical protein